MRSAVTAFIFLLGSARPVHAGRDVLIMLDPGHGGSNTGALGPTTKQYEKRLTSILAEKTAQQLQSLIPDARVGLTRYRDTFVTLDQRVRKANRAQATVFVSIHLNASASHAQRGFETYVLSRDASDQEARSLARAHSRQRQQRTANLDRHSDVMAIIADMQQRANQGKSLRLASAIQRALAAAHPTWRNRGVRRAPFDVLMGLRMPGILVEVGFIDHPIEGSLLAQSPVQDRIARALAQGIFTYLRSDPDALARRVSGPAH